MKKILYLLPQERYNEAVTTRTAALIAGKKSCYVTLNKTFARLREMLRDCNANTDSMRIVDAVTPRLFTNISDPQVTFMNAIGSMDAVTDTILTAVKMHKADLLIFDSLSSLMTFQQDKDIVAFLDYLIAFLEKLHVDVVFFALREDQDRQLIKHAQMMVDETRK